MYPLILMIHIVVCVGLVLIVLLQTGKGAGLSGLFGGGTSEQLFSAPSGSAFLKKVTTSMAVIFALTSILLTFHAARRGLQTIVEEVPVAPAPPPVSKSTGA